MLKFEKKLQFSKQQQTRKKTVARAMKKVVENLFLSCVVAVDCCVIYVNQSIVPEAAVVLEAVAFALDTFGVEFGEPIKLFSKFCFELCERNARIIVAANSTLKLKLT